MAIISDTKDKKETMLIFFRLLLATSLAILAALQAFGTSRDVEQYEIFFQDLDCDYSGRFEPLFVYFSIALKHFYDDFGFFIFSVTFISLLIKFKLIINNKHAIYFLLMYLLILFPLHELTQYRISLALAFSYLGLYLKEHKYNSISLIFLIASIFMHYSTAIFIPFYVLWEKIKEHPKTMVFVFFTIIFFIKNYIFNYAFTINQTLIFDISEDVNFFSFRNIIFLVINIIGYFEFNNLPINRRSWLAFSTYGFGLFVIFADIPVFAHRLLEETIFSYFLWISFLPLRARILVFIVFAALGIYLLYRSIYIDPLLV